MLPVDGRISGLASSGISANARESISTVPVLILTKVLERGVAMPVLDGLTERYCKLNIELMPPLQAKMGDSKVDWDVEVRRRVIDLNVRVIRLELTVKIPVWVGTLATVRLVESIPEP